MHELSLALSILEIVEQEIGQRCGGRPHGRVESVLVRVGKMSSVEPEALAFAWEVIREQSPFPEAELRIETVRARAECGVCASSFFLDGGEGQCAACGPVAFRLIEGRELEVRRIVWEPAEAVV